MTADRSTTGRKSQRKGKRAADAAARYLTRLGYPTIRNRNAEGLRGANDLRAPEGQDSPLHDRLWIEVKSQKAIRLGTAALAKAMEQAETAARTYPANDPYNPYVNTNPCYIFVSNIERKKPAVLWMNGSNGWALTFRTEWGATTVTGDGSIDAALKCLIRTEGAV